MALPAFVGKLVQFNSTYSDQVLPAIVIEIPQYLIGGALNDDGAGNPVIVSLCVFSMQGDFPKYHIKSSELGDPGTWSELPTG